MRRGAQVPALAVVVALALAGCGSDDPEAAAGQDSSGASTRSGPETDPGEGPSGGRGGFPGVSGKVAAVSRGVAQVQGSDGQSAVALADATVTTTEAARLSDLEVGQCVMVGFAESQTSEDAGPATTVSISDPVDGQCSAFGGGRDGRGDQGDERPEGAPADAPSGAPAGLPSGAPQGGRPGGERVSGTVTAVGSEGFTVAAVTMPAPPRAGSSASAAASPEKHRTESREVVVDSQTAWTRAVDGTTADVAEGRCVMATGEKDETGALEAESIRVSDAVDGECAVGGGFGGGRR